MNSAFQLVNNSFGLWVAANNNPTDDEWNDYLNTMIGLARLMPAGQRFRIVAISDGSGPNAKQRAEVQKRSQDLLIRTAVVSTSTIARNLVTAFGWMKQDMRGFSPDDPAKAMAYLGVDAATWDQAIMMAVALEPKVGQVTALRRLLSAPTKRAL